MRNFALGLVILFLISCKEKTKESLSFDIIDVSMYNGWTDYYCMKIFQDGQAYIFNNRHRKGEKYFRINIDKIELDSISALVKLVLSSNIDTLYECGCQDCGAYNLIINSGENKFKSFINGIDSENKEIDSMNDLINYLYSIAEKSRDAIDSVFVFESRNSHFYPPPPPPIDGYPDFDVPNVIDTVSGPIDARKK
jgi:hypothetical protein